MFRFDAWYFLLLFLGFPWLWKFLKQKAQLPKVRYVFPKPPPKKQFSPMRAWFFLRFLVFCFGVLALSRPQWGETLKQQHVSGIEIILVLDVSYSMNIIDLSEKGRSYIAKKVILNFIPKRAQDRIGVVIFSGEAVTLAPPTLDHALVQQVIREAKVGGLKSGTAIGDGLSVAVNRLRNSHAKSKIVILLTDGDNNLGRIDPETAGDLAKEFGIRVYTIAIGKEGRVKLPIKQRDFFGNIVTTYQWFENALNPTLLKKIAQNTGGKFYRVIEGSFLEKVFNDIDQLEKSSFLKKRWVQYHDLFPWGLKAMFGLLLLEFVGVFGGIWKWIP